MHVENSGTLHAKSPHYRQFREPDVFQKHSSGDSYHTFALFETLSNTRQFPRERKTRRVVLNFSYMNIPCTLLLFLCLEAAKNVAE
jgi:hypothetical protein